MPRTAAELLVWLQQFEDEQGDEQPGGAGEGAHAGPGAGSVEVPPEVPPGMWWCSYCHAVIEWAWGPEVTPDFRCSAYVIDLWEGRARCTGTLYQAPKLPSARLSKPGARKAKGNDDATEGLFTRPTKEIAR